MLVMTVATLALLALAAPAAASVYGWLDAPGGVAFSEPPAPLAEPPARPAAEGLTTMDDLMELSGLNRQFRALAELLAGEFQLEQSQLGPEDRALARRVLADALDPERLRQATRAELLRHADARRIDALAAWYQAPLGARRRAATAVLGTPAGRQQLADFAGRLPGDPPAPARLALVERLDSVEGGTDANVEIVLAAARGIRRALNALLSPAQRQRTASLDRQIEQAREQVQAAVQRQVMVATLFVHRGFSDEEFQAIIAFVGSDPSRWLDGLLRQALGRTVTEAAGRATRDLVRAIPLERWQAAPLPAAR